MDSAARHAQLVFILIQQISIVRPAPPTASSAILLTSVSFVAVHSTFTVLTPPSTSVFPLALQLTMPIRKAEAVSRASIHASTAHPA